MESEECLNTVLLWHYNILHAQLDAQKCRQSRWHWDNSSKQAEYKRERLNVDIANSLDFFFLERILLKLTANELRNLPYFAAVSLSSLES